MALYWKQWRAWRRRKKVLEIGSGTAILSLMLAQRNGWVYITAIDIEPHAAGLSKRNFERSLYKDRFKVCCWDFNEYVIEKSLI
ncbi:MAG: methyltransferase [Bergeyella sp.]|nr:methyltransferase [Bergeyella sp.]